MSVNSEKKSDVSGSTPDQSFTEPRIDDYPADKNPIEHDVLQNEVRAAYTTSPGVGRIEALVSCANFYERSIIYFGTFLIGYTYGLGGTIISNSTTYGLFQMDHAAMQSSVNVVSTVAGAASYPVGAKLSDVMGRLELLLFGLLLYILGMIVSAAAQNYETLAGGSVLYRIGMTLLQQILETLIADFSSMRARVFLSFLPALPFILNAWIGGNVSEAVFGADSQNVWMWRWGFGMWALILPVMSLPLIFTLVWLHFKAHKRGLLKNHPSIFSQRTSITKYFIDLFWLFDVVGVILVVGVLILILFPLTLAGGYQSQWKTAKIIAPICVGFALIFPWVLYEMWAPHPLIPFRKMGHIYILSPICIACFLDLCFMMEADYLYTMLLVCFDYGTLSATRISSMYSFCSVISGFCAGLVIYFVRRIKIFILAGTCIFMLGFGLLIRYRGGLDDRVGLVAAECVLGVGGGLFSYPAQAVIQGYVPHEDMATITGLYLALYSVGSAIGAAISGAVYTNILPKQLTKNIPSSNSTILDTAYGNPLTLITEFAMGTSVREGMIDSYKYVQRIMCIIGCCLCVVLLVAAIILPNPILTDDRSLVEEDQEEIENATPTFWQKAEKALSLPPKKRLRDENQSKFQRVLDELW